MWFEAASDITFPVTYEVDGEFVVPTSATYVLRDHDGTSLATGSVVGGSVTTTAAQNAISAAWENRYLTIVFVYDGRTYTRLESYKLSAFIPLSITPGDVRGLIGLDQNELPDEDIDLWQAYHSLTESEGATFTQGFLETGARNRSANRAVSLFAAITIASSFPLRTQIRVQGENSAAARMAEIDFEELIRKLKGELAKELAVASETLVAESVIFSLSTPTDVITGQ